MSRRAKPQTTQPNMSATPMLTVGREASSTRATRRDFAAGEGEGKTEPPMRVGQQPLEKAAGESQFDARTGSTPSLAQVLDRLATQLDDSTHAGIGLTVRLMIESREEKARERQADGYPLVKEKSRLRLPVDGPGAQNAFLRFIHAAATPGTSSGWRAKLEQELFSDIASVENLARQGEGRHLEIASAGKLTIADLVSRLVHLRTRLTFWAASLEVYPPPLVGDVVGLIVEAARQLRYAAHLPSLVSGETNSPNSSESGDTVDARTARSAAADHGGIPPALATSQVVKAQAPRPIGSNGLMMEQPHAVQPLQWEAERLAKSRPRVRLMVSLGSRWIGGIGPWDDIPKDHIPSSWMAFLCARQIHVKHLFARNYHAWIASTSQHALGECCELAYAVSAFLLRHSAPEPLGSFGVRFGRFQGNQPEASEVSVFAALAEAAADGVVFTQQRERVRRNLQYAGNGFGIRVSEVAGSFGAVKTVPNYERYFAGWDDPDAGYFMEPLRDANGAIASVLQHVAKFNPIAPTRQQSSAAAPADTRAWSTQKVEEAERLGKLPTAVLAAVVSLNDKSKAEITRQVVRAALIEANGNVQAAMTLLKEWGHERCQATVYTCRNKLKARGLEPASGREVSKMDGKLEGMHIVRNRRKSGEHKG